MDAGSRNDEELAAAAVGGDEAAFAELYQRHFDHLYDYAIRLTQDRDLAALVVQASFLGAYGSLSGAGPKAPFRLQLLANAHYDLANRLRGRRGAPSVQDEPLDEMDPARLRDVEHIADLPELGRAAWRAASDLRPDELELLELSDRQGFDAAEIASVLRTRPETVQGRLGRAQEAYEESYTAAVLMDRGRRACVDLDFVVGGDMTWSAGLRRRVLKHHQTCQTCQATRRRYPPALDAFAALRPRAAPAGWQETILTRLNNAIRTGQFVTGAPTAAPPSTPPPEQPVPVPAGARDGLRGWLSRTFASGPRGPLFAALGIALLIIIVVLGALCGAGAFDRGEEPTPTPTVTPTPTATETPTSTPTATPTDTPTFTPVPPTPTPVPPTPTPVPTETPVPPTPTPEPTEPPEGDDNGGGGLGARGGAGQGVGGGRDPGGGGSGRSGGASDHAASNGVNDLGD